MWANRGNQQRRNTIFTRKKVTELSVTAKVTQIHQLHWMICLWRVSSSFPRNKYKRLISYSLRSTLYAHDSRFRTQNLISLPINNWRQFRRWIMKTISFERWAKLFSSLPSFLCEEEFFMIIKLSCKTFYKWWHRVGWEEVGGHFATLDGCLSQDLCDSFGKQFVGFGSANRAELSCLNAS